MLLITSFVKRDSFIDLLFFSYIIKFIALRLDLIDCEQSVPLCVEVVSL